MKSDQITETGFYWYFHNGGGEEAVIVCVHPDKTFSFCGNEMRFQADEMQGRFIGPVRYPPGSEQTIDNVMRAQAAQESDDCALCHGHWPAADADRREAVKNLLEIAAGFKD